MKRWSNLLTVTIFIVTSTIRVFSQPYIPDDLKPWKEWVLQKYPHCNCIPLYNDPNQKRCSFVSSLTLDIKKDVAIFRETVRVVIPSDIIVPGDSRAWPQHVKVNGKAHAVIEREMRPTINLPPGDFLVEGSITFGDRPSQLPVPSDAALITVTLDGNKLVNPDINGGIIVLGKPQESTPRTVADALDVKVFRKIKDGIPILVETNLHLAVSGSEREITLGQFALDNSIPYSFFSDLPSKIQPDGSIRVQLKPGKWTISATSRLKNGIDSLKSQSSSPFWPEQEIWCFEAAHSLRRATITGVTQIDPSQTEMSSDWKQFPTYLVYNKNVFRLTVDSTNSQINTPSDALTLQRTYWLDYSGRAFTIRDNIQGTIHQSWRMSMNSICTLGSATLNNEPQMVTRINQNKPGIEVRNGPIDLTTVSKVHRTFSLPASGWDHKFNSMNASINLPPAWSLFHAIGPEHVSNSWINSWSLWDIFLLFLITFIIWRLTTASLGCIALVTLLLTHNHYGAPLLLWLALAISVGLYNLIKAKKIRDISGVLYTIVIVWIAIVSTTFSVRQVKAGLYPQTVNETLPLSDRILQLASSDQVPPPPPPPPAPSAKLSSPPEFQGAQESYRSADSYQDKRVISLRNRPTYDPSLKIQTGPGIPSWNGNAVYLTWPGPVTAHEQMHLLLVPPFVNRVLCFMRIAFLALLLFGFLRQGFGKVIVESFVSIKKHRGAMLLLFFALSLTMSSQELFAETPSKEMLEELEKRLIRNDPCFPLCASYEHCAITVHENEITITSIIHAARDILVPVPGSRFLWSPASVSVNNSEKVSLTANENGTVSCLLRQGQNAVVLRGPLTRNDIEIPFHMDVKNVSVSRSSLQWSISGIFANRLTSNTLHLQRTESRTAEQQETKSFFNDLEPPFLKVTRTITLDNEWMVTTDVNRESPQTGAISLSLPLLNSEQVLTAGVADSQKHAQVAMSADQQSFSWESIIPKNDSLILIAPVNETWREIWSVRASTRWNVSFNGITPAHFENEVTSWTPRPGDTLIISVKKPQAVDGQTLTIDKADFTIRQGKRSRDVNLELMINSSQADKIAISIPGDIEITSVSVAYQDQIVSKNSTPLVIAVNPGPQLVKVTWTEAITIPLLYKVPHIKLNSSLTNLTLNLTFPQDRWILALGGATQGPAVQFWAVFVGIILVAFFLSRFKTVPVRTHEWILLLSGFSTANGIGGFFIIAFFILFAIRARFSHAIAGRHFNQIQIILGIAALAALISLITTLPQGLLSTPQMFIAGNQSGPYQYNWYLDRSPSTFINSFVFSLPMWVYRVAMLAWSFWLALTLPRWGKWGWECFKTNGIWKKINKSPKTARKNSQSENKKGNNIEMTDRVS